MLYCSHAALDIQRSPISFFYYLWFDDYSFLPLVFNYLKALKITRRKEKEKKWESKKIGFSAKTCTCKKCPWELATKSAKFNFFHWASIAIYRLVDVGLRRPYSYTRIRVCCTLAAWYIRSFVRSADFYFISTEKLFSLFCSIII